MADNRKSDYGFSVTFRVLSGATGANLSGLSFTTKQLVFRKPSGTLSAITANLSNNAASGVLSATISDGLLSQIGQYSVEAFLSGATFRYTSQADHFEIGKKFNTNG